MTIKDDYHRDYVISENQGRGPCHLQYKPIRVCVRSEHMKIVYEIPPSSPENGFVAECYNLDNDPEEYKNIAGNRSILYKASNLIEVAENRVKEILH